jgi:HSP20 family protein
VALPDLAESRHRLDQAFRDLSEGAQRSGWSPFVDVVKRDDKLVLRADLPGIKPDEVKIEIEGDMLTVSGEHREESEEKKEH